MAGPHPILNLAMNHNGALKPSHIKVRMVERRGTGKIYALKYISKSQVIKMDAVRNVLRERQILETLDHPFVVNMRFAFQDDEYMYMCMDLMMGGDLRFHLNRKRFGEDVVRFWIAELSCAIAHLHSQAIVHRDIKPDNVLLDEKGHAHLTDFNIGCKLTSQKPVLTSQSGTVAYMAPEVFSGSGYGTSVDWWALGVVFYECIYNKRPFQTDSIGELKKAIPTQTIDFPEKDGVSRECISAMRGFLTRDPKERLGIKDGMEGIRHHPFFQAGAYQTTPDKWWSMLETKQLTPKFQPSTETNNFDATYDLEELLLDDEPLTYRSTRKRALRMQKEKDKALKEESARLKFENEAALAAADLAMQAMALSADDYDHNHGSYNNTKNNHWDQQQHLHQQGKPDKQNRLVKKRSKLYLGGSKDKDRNKEKEESDSNSSSTNNSYAPLSTAPPLPSYAQQQQFLHHQKQHQQLPPLPPHQQQRQPAQFQSIPNSSVSLPSETSSAGRQVPGSMAIPQFPMFPPPSASRQSGQHIRTSQPIVYSRHPSAGSLPPVSPQGVSMSPTSQNQPPMISRHSSLETRRRGNQSIGATSGSVGEGHSGNTVTGYTYTTAGSQGPGVTAIYLSKPA
ncbi:hypothetical protein BGZ98_000484, partial [Dissophora globulifera]